MRFKPAITTGIQDLQIRQLFEFVFQLLGIVVQYDIYKTRNVWHVPFRLDVPTGKKSSPRVQPPDVVRLGRALVVQDEITPVYTGAVLWRWLGNSQVMIEDVEGLVDGVTYDLVFEVLSGQ